MSARARGAILAGVAAVFIAGYFVLLVSNLCAFAAGPDSSGYLNEARMLLAGRTSVTVEPLVSAKLDPALVHLFTPYGFMRGPEPGTMVPTYPVGTPLHLAAGAAIGGWRLAPYLVVPLAAIASLFLIAFIATRLGVGRGWGVAAAVLLAAFPLFIAQAVQPVSDVLGAFWALAAIACALRATERWPWAALAGAAFAIGVAVRPTNILVALPLLLALRCRWRPVTIAALAALPFALALMAYHSTLYGSPFTTGYGGPGAILSLGGAPPCLSRHASWLVTMATPLLFPLALLAVFVRRVAGWHRALLLSWFGVFFAFYAYYDHCPDTSATRFLLPALPPLILGFVCVASSLAAWLAPRWPRVARVVAVLLVVAVLTTEVVQIGRLHVLHLDDWEAIFPRTVAWVDREVPHDAVVLSSILSGAFYFHSGRITIRWDQLTPETATLLRTNPRFAGPWFAAVSEVEGGGAALRERVPGEWRAVGQIRDVTIWRLEERLANAPAREGAPRFAGDPF